MLSKYSAESEYLEYLVSARAATDHAALPSLELAAGASSAAVEHVSLRAEVKTTEAGNGKLLTPLGDTHFHRVMRLARAQLKPCMSASDNLQEF